MTNLASIQRQLPPHIRPLIERPLIAWPTLFWFSATLVFWTISTVSACKGWLSLWLAVPCNVLMVFSFFTIIHDASHRAISRFNVLNEGLGFISTLFYGPAVVYGFKAFRYLHMQHHLHTNEPDKDPDYWCAGHSWPRLILSWFTVDLFYVVYYLRQWSTRPLSEKAELIFSLMFNGALFVYFCYQGHFTLAFWLWLIPGRIAMGLLGFTLDYLPHYPHQQPQSTHPFQATSIRVGASWLLTPILMYHNYHLMHHLFPLAPFYRYSKIWYSNRDEFLKQAPSLVSLRGKPLTVEAYLQQEVKRGK